MKFSAKVIDQLSKNLVAMTKRASAGRGWLNRVGYQLYIEAQENRFITEGASEGKPWGPLNAKYAEWKRKRFADYPGGGTKMMIATGQLLDALTKKESPFHRKIVNENSLIIQIINEKKQIKEAAKKTKGKKSKSKLNEELKKRRERFPAFNYASFANEKRNFSRFSPQTKEHMAKEFMKYVRGGK